MDEVFKNGWCSKGVCACVRASERACLPACERTYVCCVRACVRACVHACERASVRACVRVCYACVGLCVYVFSWSSGHSVNSTCPCFAALTGGGDEVLQRLEAVSHLVEVGLLQHDARHAAQRLDVVLQHVQRLRVHLRLEVHRRALAWGPNLVSSKALRGEKKGRRGHGKDRKREREREGGETERGRDRETEGERDRERERETEWERERLRQTDRQTDRDRDRETDRQTDWG